jgi:hypothetical protein
MASCFAAAPVDAATQHDPTADFNSALGGAATQFGLATGVGGMVGASAARSSAARSAPSPAAP